MIFDAHGDILTDMYQQQLKNNENSFKERHLDLYKKVNAFFNSQSKPISSCNRWWAFCSISSSKRGWLQHVLVHKPGEWYLANALWWIINSPWALNTNMEKARCSVPLSWASIFFITPTVLSSRSTSTTFAVTILRFFRGGKNKDF